MKFRCVPLAEARGHILGHNVSHEGRRLLKKGRRITDATLAELAGSGIESVYVAELESTDVDEDSAAQRIGSALEQSSGLRAEAATGGRISLRAPSRGVLSVDAERLLELNLLEGVTLATRGRHAVLQQGEHAGTLKIIPFALAEARVRAAVQLAEQGVVQFRRLEPRCVQILVCGSEGLRERLVETYRRPLETRLLELGMPAARVTYAALGRDPERTLTTAIVEQSGPGIDLLLVVGETATMDVDDLIPQAIREAGGEVSVLGAPVFPGNLLLLGYRERCAILGTPGCARSRAQNVVDLLLPRLLTGERPGPREIAELGLGGLLVSTGVEDARQTPAERGGLAGGSG